MMSPAPLSLSSSWHQASTTAACAAPGVAENSADQSARSDVRDSFVVHPRRSGYRISHHQRGTVMADTSRKTIKAVMKCVDRIPGGACGLGAPRH